MLLYLDDLRPAPQGWHLVKTSKAAIEALKTGKVTEVSLDHDLGSPYENGMDVLLWIEKMVATQGYKPPKIHIHTANPSARIKMNLAVKKIHELANSNLTQ